MADRPQHSDSIDLVKHVYAHQFSSVKLSSQIYWTPFTAPSILFFNTDQSWSSLHAWVESYSVTLSTHFAKRQHHISPTPSRRTLSSLFNTISRLDINAEYESHGGFFWARQSTKYLTMTQSFLLWSQNFSSHPCKSSRSVPLGPMLPESFCTTNSTTSSVISTGIKTGVASYTSNATPRDFSCMDFSLPILPCQFYP